MLQGKRWAPPGLVLPAVEQKEGMLENQPTDTHATWMQAGPLDCTPRNDHGELAPGTIESLQGADHPVRAETLNPLKHDGAGQTEQSASLVGGPLSTPRHAPPQPNTSNKFN